MTKDANESGEGALAEDLLTLNQVAKRLGVSRYTVRARLLRPGMIWPVVYLSARTIRVKPAVLQRYIDDRETPEVRDV